MKTLKDVLELTNLIILNNNESYNTAMVNYSGHVNLLSVDSYRMGYDRKELSPCEVIFNGYLNTETEIQVAYFTLLGYCEKCKFC